MKKRIIAIVSALAIVGAFTFSQLYNVKEARAESQYKKTPQNLNDDCYDTGGNCVDVYVITDTIHE